MGAVPARSGIRAGVLTAAGAPRRVAYPPRVALDRQSIERRDFPIARRGYDIEAVDAHLSAVAEAVEGLRRPPARTRPESLASAASEQVRAIVEAAEQSAAELEREAQLEARQIRQDAREDGERSRVEAARQAREHVQRVADAARAMLERVQTLEQQLGGLLETVRGGASRVSGDLGLLEASVATLQTAADAAPEPAPLPPAPARAPQPAPHLDPEPTDPVPVPAPVPPAAARDAAHAAAGAVPAASDPVGGAAAPSPVTPAVDAPAAEEVAGTAPPGATDPVGGAAAAVAAQPAGNGGPAAGGDDEGARLIALNMALNGTSREDAERYLSTNFELADPGALLDDVYARLGR